MVQARVKVNVERLGHIQRIRGGGTMSSQLLNGMRKSGVTTASSRDSARDEELVAAAKRGDEVAFEALVKRHRRAIFLIALRYTRVREDAEDIVQQTFQKAFVHLHKFEGRSS